MKRYAQIFQTKYLKYQLRNQVLDATLKEITAALLESDVNVKLVASLRQKVKAKVKATLESNAADKSKDTNRKNLIQKVRLFLSVPYIYIFTRPYRPYLTN
jgi:signal recognition particle subunit SRP54